MGSSNAKIPTVKKMLPAEIQERRRKGLCYTCDGRYEPGHKCKRLFLIDTYASEELEETIADTSRRWFVGARTRNLVESYKGDWSPHTMRMKAQLQGEEIIILLDTGNSRNFISKQVVDKLQLQVEKGWLMLR